MNYYDRAKQIQNEMLINRRFIHQNAEVGMKLPNTHNYIFNKLIDIGYEPTQICESGILATIGKIVIFLFFFSDFLYLVSLFFFF